MKRFRTDWRRTLVHPISKIFVSAVGELSGRSRRRRTQSKESSLAALRAERDRLQQDMQELIQYTDTEIEHLKQTIDRLRYERDALQMQVWLLEEQISQDSHLQEPLLPLNESDPPGTAPTRSTPPSVMPTSTPTPDPPLAATVQTQSIQPAFQPDVDDKLTLSQDADIHAESQSDTFIDLSGLRLALIGGHPSTRRGVIQELQLNYGLRHVVEIPRMTESNTNRAKVKSKIRRCTLVVLITGYMSHRLTEIVFSLKDAGSLAGDVLQLNCRGKSGVVREILNHLAQAEG